MDFRLCRDVCVGRSVPLTPVPLTPCCLRGNCILLGLQIPFCTFLQPPLNSWRLALWSPPPSVPSWWAPTGCGHWGPLTGGQIIPERRRRPERSISVSCLIAALSLPDCNSQGTAACPHSCISLGSSHIVHSGLGKLVSASLTSFKPWHVKRLRCLLFAAWTLTELSA